MNNTTHLVSIQLCDWGVSPTEWQRSVFPSEYHEKISVIHDGIDCEVVKPDLSAKLVLPNGVTLSARDEVVTYVARSLEPHRGFPTFMRAVAESCKRRPNTHYVIGSAAGPHPHAG
jgi:glycosyltransferase involved in cell wall biosynthesis